MGVASAAPSEETMTMRTLRRLILTLPLSLSLGVGLGAVPATVAAAADDPVVTVTPSTGLVDGATVQVVASGLPPATAITVNYCDRFSGYDEFDEHCADNSTVTSDADGRVDATVTISDFVLRVEPFGDALPVYCLADSCRIFLVWTDPASGALQFVASDPLELTGSPATITASPSADLRKKQWVRASGTAYGAEGRTVVIVEEACFAIIQASGCYGTIVKGSTTVAADGTYALRVRATRYLADGTDCADPTILGDSCQLTAQILDATGQPDGSFGFSQIGDPGVQLTFRS